MMERVNKAGLNGRECSVISDVTSLQAAVVVPLYFGLGLNPWLEIHKQ